MTHYDDAKESFRCEHGYVRSGPRPCPYCEPELLVARLDRALAHLTSMRDENKTLRARLALAEKVCEIVDAEGIPMMKWRECTEALEVWRQARKADDAE